VDSGIRTTMPTGTMTTATVAALDYYPGSDAALDLPGLPADVGRPAGIIINTLVSNVIEHEGVPGVQEGVNQCLAGATARSIAWLNARYNLGSLKSAQQIYEDTKALNTGTYTERLAAIAAYLSNLAAASGATASTKVLMAPGINVGNPAGVTLVTGQDMKQWIRDELNRGEDVTLDYDTHIVTVTGTFDVGGNTFLKFRDDENQRTNAFGDAGTKMGGLSQDDNGDWQFRPAGSNSFFKVRLVMSKSVYRTVVTVSNVAPSVSAANDGPVDEGQPVNVTITASDPAGPLDDPLIYEWDWDNDGTYDFSSTSTNVASHVYAGGGTYTVAVRVTDHDGGWATASTVVSVRAINDPPQVELRNPVTTLPEDADTSAGIRVADVVVIDDELGTNLVSIGGADGAMFVIQGGQLRLRPGAVLDFETNPELEVIVTVNDETVGGTPDDTATLTITVTDANDPPQVALTGTTTWLPESTGTTDRIKVADIVVTDQDTRPEYLQNVVSLMGPDAAWFEIDGTELYLKAGTALNADVNPVLDVTVAVDDDSLPGSPDATAALAISILRERVPSEWKFDFNAGNGVTEPGYVGVPVTKRYAGGGSDFGWSPTAAPLASFDRYGPDSLRRDGHYGYDGTFLLDVPAAGPYVVTVVIGDTSPFYHDRIEIWAEGAVQLTVNTTAGQWSMPSFVVPVNDGTLTLQLRDTGGVDPHYVINALRVRAQSLVRTLTVTPPSPSAPLDADGTTIDTYTVSGATPNTLATVASSLGAVTGMDHDPTIQGVQVPTGTGSFTFTVKRPSGVVASPSDARITVQEVEGTGLGEAVQQFQPIADPGTVLRYDFNASATMTAPGFTHVGPRDIYSATRGYGWSTRVAAADRATSGMSLLNRDLHTGSNATFSVNAEPGRTYHVRVYLSNPLGTGGYRYTYDNFDVIAGGQTFHVDNLEPGIVTVHTFVVTMAAGDTVLNVQFVDRGGQNFNWVVSGMDIWTTMDPGQQALLADAAGTPAATGAALSAEALAPVVAEASAWWSATGLTAAQSAALAQVQFQVADLGGAYLGLADTAMGVVRIDDDAAGWGWSLVTGHSSLVTGHWSLVTGDSSLHNGQRTNDKGQMADDGFDLLHVVLHEIGHVLGYGHSADADDLMAPVLAASPLAPSVSVPHPASRIPDLASRISDPSSRLDAVLADWSAGESVRLDSDHSEFTHPVSGARRTEDEDELWVPRRLRTSPYEEAVDAFLTDWDGELE